MKLKKELLENILYILLSIGIVIGYTYVGENSIIPFAIWVGLGLVIVLGFGFVLGLGFGLPEENEKWMKRVPPFFISFIASFMLLSVFPEIFGFEKIETKKKNYYLVGKFKFEMKNDLYLLTENELQGFDELIDSYSRGEEKVDSVRFNNYRDKLKKRKQVSQNNILYKDSVKTVFDNFLNSKIGTENHKKGIDSITLEQKMEIEKFFSNK